MRIILLIILVVFCSEKTFSQHSISAIVKQREILTPHYDVAAAGGKVLYLAMEYGGSVFSYNQKDAIKDLQHAVIARIDLVYSDYPAKKDFSPLTQKRLESLQKELPKVFRDKNIEFRKIRQSAATDKETAASLSHGFFIYYRPLPDKSSAKKEIKKLKTSLLTPLTDTSKTVTDTTDVPWCWSIVYLKDTNVASLPELHEGFKRSIMRMSIKEAIAQYYLSGESEEQFRATYGDTLFIVSDKREEGCLGDDYFQYEKVDSTVSKVFKRHNWNRSLIIADVTGSMYPYTGQLLQWLKLTLTDQQKRYFVFFNDGDAKPDETKVIGKTGGIYPVFSNQYDEIESTIIKAMQNGGGGDVPENNIEALLESNKVCKDCDSIVMIADNWAPIKDISLLASYNKPVKIVLCGVFERINKDYLKLARETKGSLHLIEEDIYRLSELKEGQTIKIHGYTYKLVGGNFVDITPMSL